MAAAVSVLPETSPRSVTWRVCSFVEAITPMLNATYDATISEGDTILNADDLRASGLDGTGVKVGSSPTASTGCRPRDQRTQDIASDNLPGAANTCGHTTVSTIADKPAPRH